MLLRLDGSGRERSGRPSEGTGGSEAGTGQARRRRYDQLAKRPGPPCRHLSSCLPSRYQVLPVLHRSLVGETPYTTQLGAGLGLIAETVRLLDLWETGMTGQRLLRIALESGAFATISARRLRNIVIEAFAPRYLVDEARPARVLKILLGRIPQPDQRQMLFLYTCRANPILADFICEVYWQRYGAGA
jgi:hypothetical protein